MTTFDPGRSRRRSSARGPAEPTPGSVADLTPEADPESVVRTIVLTQLTAAPRSRAQLETKLASRGAPADVVARVLDRFEEVGLVDDAAYAEALVRSKQASRGLSGAALRHELRRSGVDDETAHAALAGLDPDVELATARALVQRKIPSTRGLPYAKRVNRLVGLLARKGYPGSTALRVVKDAINADGQDGPDTFPDGDGPDDLGPGLASGSASRLESGLESGLEFGRD